MVIEKLIHAQMALFFDSIENRPDKLARKIEDNLDEIFDQMPNIIPLPADTPEEIPRVMMQSYDEIYTCNISASRVDFIANFSKVDGEIDTIFDTFLINAEHFLNAVLESKDVIRFGLIGQYFIQEDDLTKKLKDKYFKSSIGDFDELSLKFNKRFQYNGLTFNDVIDINYGMLNGPNDMEIRGGFIQKDMNNLPSVPIELDMLLNLIQDQKSAFFKNQIERLIK